MDDLVVAAVLGGCGHDACVVVVAAAGRPNLVAGLRRSYNPEMLSQETLDEYRRMTPGQRLELALKMTTENLPALVAGPPEVVSRRFELLKRENDLRNANMREAMARTRTAS